MARFVIADDGYYVNLDDVRDILADTGNSRVSLGMRSTTNVIHISCANDAEASAVAANLAQAYDPKA